MRRWWVWIVVAGCAPETIVAPPPPPDAGPPATTRDGGVVEPDFDAQLFGASGTLNRLVTYPLDDPSQRLTLLPPRPADYGLPVGAFGSPIVTPDRRGIVYHYDAFEARAQYLFWIDATQPQDQPRTLYSATNMFIQALAVSNTHVVVRDETGTFLVTLGEEVEVRRLSAEVATTAHFVGDFVVLVYRTSVNRIVSFAVDRPATVTLLDDSEATSPTVMGIAGSRVLVRNLSFLLALDAATGDRTDVASAQDCMGLLAVSADASEIFCRNTIGGVSSVVGLRVDGTTSEAPRTLMSPAFDPSVSDDGRWLWAFSTSTLDVIDTETGAIVTSSTVARAYVSISDVTADGQYASLRGNEGGALLSRDRGLVVARDDFFNTFDPTQRFVLIGNSSRPSAYEIATDTFHVLPAYPAVFTVTGAHNVIVENGLRLYRVDGIGRAEPASDWFDNGNTYTTHDDALITDRGPDGLWKTPRVASPSTKLAKHGDPQQVMVVNDRLVAFYRHAEFNRRVVESYAMDGRDMEASPERWERFPDVYFPAGDHVVGVSTTGLEAIRVDGVPDEPRVLYASTALWLARWADAIDRIVLIEIRGAELLTVTVSLDGEAKEVARFGTENQPFFDFTLDVVGERAYVAQAATSQTWVVDLRGESPPETLAESGRLSYVFSSQRRAIFLSPEGVSLIDLDTGAREPLAAASSQFGLSVVAPSEQAFAYYDNDVLKVARSIVPLETVEVGFGLGAIAFTPDLSALYHFGSFDGRLHRYDFELGWSRVLTDVSATVQTVFPIEAPYPIIRAVVDSEPGVYALFADGRMRPLLDLPESAEVYYDTTPSE